MKDFKNENEYDNMKLDDEAYDGILLKTGDEGYRYYSSSNSSTSSSGSGNSSGGSGNGSNGSSGNLGNVIINDPEYSKATSGDDYVWKIKANCKNAWNMCLYLDRIDTNERVLSKGTSSCEITGECRGLSEGKYRVTAVAIPYKGTSKTITKVVDIYEVLGEVEIHYDVLGVDMTDSENSIYSVSVSANCTNSDKMVVKFSEDTSRNYSVESQVFGIQRTLKKGSHVIEVTAYGKNEKGKAASSSASEAFDLTEGSVPTSLNVSVVRNVSETSRAVKVTETNEMTEPTTIYLECIKNNSDKNDEVIYSIASSIHELSYTKTLEDGTYTFIATTEIQRTGTKTFAKKTVTYPVSTTGGGVAGGGPGGDVNPSPAPNPNPEFEDVPDNARKFLLLYTGPNLDGGNYPKFENDDIEDLKECGATDFVILTAASLNVDTSSGRIIDKIGEFVNCTDCDYDTAFNEYEKIYKEHFIELGITKSSQNNAIDLHKKLWGLWGEKSDQVINTIETPVSEEEYKANSHLKIFTAVNMGITKEEQLVAIATEDNRERNYREYANSVADLASRMVGIIPNCRLWIGLPPIIPGASFLAERYKTAYKDLLTLIKYKSSIAPNSYWDNVVGVYYGTEDIPPGYVAFEKEQVTNNFNCSVVRTMRWLKEECVKNLDTTKKLSLLWIPYYRNFADNGGIITGIPERIGSVANNTDIFDFVILQPSYYFKPQHKAVVELIKQCVGTEKCVQSNYRWGNNIWVKEGGYSQVCSEYVTEGLNMAIIGAEMEIDGKIDTDENYSERYNWYVHNFKEFITGKGESGKTGPVAFYVGDRDSLMNTSVYQKVKEFFTSI